MAGHSEHRPQVGPFPPGAQHDAGPGSHADGCQPPAHQAHPGGLPGEGRCRRCSRSPGPQAAQRNTRCRGGRRSAFARTRYAGANHTHLSELLGEREGIDTGRTTLRRILVNAGLSSPRRRRPPKHRVRRQRMPREGMLISRWTAVITRGWGIRHRRSRC